MSFWSQLSFQEGVTSSMELLIFFHDYMIMFMVLILTFVSYLFVYVSLSPYIDKYTMDSHFLETIWTVVPIVILVFMAFPSLYLLYLIEEISLPTVSVNVIAHQWYWEYQYFNSWLNLSFDSYMADQAGAALGGVFHNLDVDNRLVLPVLSQVLFLVTSADVLHSWTVPSLGVKVDSIPGRLNYLSSLVQTSGVYYGQCSEVCGSNHSFIPICVEFVPMPYFISFLSSLSA